MSSDIVSYELTINAPPATVFDLLTEAEGLLQWIAVEAEVEAQPGGRISWTHENGRKVEGRFLAVEPPRRIVFTYGWQDHPTVGPGSTVVEVDLAPVDSEATHLTLVHRELPAADREDHAVGWRHFLGLLADVAGA